MATKIRLLKVVCPMCERKNAGVYQSNSRNKGLYIRCQDCSCLVFSHSSVMGYVARLMRGYGKVEFDGISRYEWDKLHK